MTRYLQRLRLRLFGSPRSITVPFTASSARSQCSALVEERSRYIESLRREAKAVRQDDTLSKQLAGMTVEGLKGLLADHSPEKALEILVDRVVLERDLTCQIELKAVPGRHNRWTGVASPRGFEPRSHP